MENRVLMSGIWISAATISSFAVAGSLMTLMAGGQSDPKAGSTIVGRVLRRQGKSDALPDVMWLVKYPDEAAHQRSLKIRLESPEFKAVRDGMKTLISLGDLGI
jgi:hypothetical protein